MTNIVQDTMPRCATATQDIISFNVRVLLLRWRHVRLDPIERNFFLYRCCRWVPLATAGCRSKCVEQNQKFFSLSLIFCQCIHFTDDTRSHSNTYIIIMMRKLVCCGLKIKPHRFINGQYQFIVICDWTRERATAHVRHLQVDVQRQTEWREREKVSKPFSRLVWLDFGGTKMMNELWAVNLIL